MTRIRLRWDSILTATLALAVGLCLGMGLQFQLDRHSPDCAPTCSQSIR